MKALTTLINFVAILSTVIICSGCANQKTWVYHANSYSPTAAATDKKIAVLPFEDSRPNENHNLWAIYLIPLVPFGSQTLNCPEGISQHVNSGLWVNYKPTEDFPKALAEDLRNTRLFSDAFFDYRRETGDYAVKGKIISTKYEGRIISYGLSVYGPDLWFIGFPATWNQNELSLELSLVDAKTEKPLFSKTYTAKPRSGCSWIYSMNSDFNYSEMLAELNKQFCADIQIALLTSPKSQ